MIEQGIYFALGCIVTALGAMMFAPVFWRRALRLTRRRLQLQIPLSMQEIFAERDQLRAEFAVERLRIDQELERVQAGKARDMAELGRRSMEVTRLADKLSALRAVEQAHEAEIDRLSREVVERDSKIISLEAEVQTATETASRLRRDSSSSARDAADCRAQSVELQASQAKITAEIAGLKMELQDAHELVERLQKDSIVNSLDASHLRTLTADLHAAQDKADSLERRFAETRLVLPNAGERESASAAQIETLQAENTALKSALDGERHASTQDDRSKSDGGLRESIHALGLAVAAMTRDSRRPASAEAVSRDAVSRDPVSRDPASRDKVQPVA